MKANMAAAAGAQPAFTPASAPGPETREKPERKTITIPEAGEALGISRNAAYEAAHRGEIPTIRIGRLLLVPKVAFERMFERPAAITASRETS